MEILNVIYKNKKGMGETFYKHLCSDGIAEATRSETGLITYNFYQSMDNPDEILLLEIWSNEETRAKHKTTKHYKRLTELYQEYVDSYTVNAYQK